MYNPIGHKEILRRGLRPGVFIEAVAHIQREVDARLALLNIVAKVYRDQERPSFEEALLLGMAIKDGQLQGLGITTENAGMDIIVDALCPAVD